MPTESQIDPSNDVSFAVEVLMEMANQAKQDETRLTRIFYNYQDFRARLADNSPVHYDIGLRQLDPEGERMEQTYRLYGADRRGRLIVYERRWPHNHAQVKQRSQIAEDFIKNIAQPLNAVPGRIESR